MGPEFKATSMHMSRNYIGSWMDGRIWHAEKPANHVEFQDSGVITTSSESLEMLCAREPSGHAERAAAGAVGFRRL